MSHVPDDLADDLADVVRRAAAGTTDHAADLDGIERRGRRRRRRRRVAVSASVACAVALAFTGTVAASRMTGTGPRLAGEPAQRLLITYPAPGVELPVGSALEVRPDGSLFRWVPASGAGASVQARSLPDGRVVTLLDSATRRMLAFVPNAGDEPPAGSPAPTNGRGTAELSVSWPGRLVGATPDVAYVWNSAGLVAYALDTGASRVVVGPRDAGFGEDWTAALGRVDVAGDTLLSWPRSASCQFVVTTLRTRATERHVVGGDACDVSAARISPDGRLAGFTYVRSAGDPLRVAVVELATGEVRADEALPLAGRAKPVGLAWHDAERLRVAVAAPPDAGRRYPVTEVLEVHTVVAA